MAKYFNESELSYKTLLAGTQQPVVTDVVKSRRANMYSVRCWLTTAPVILRR